MATAHPSAIASGLGYCHNRPACFLRARWSARLRGKKVSVLLRSAPPLNRSARFGARVRAEKMPAPMPLHTCGYALAFGRLKKPPSLHRSRPTASPQPAERPRATQTDFPSLTLGQVVPSLRSGRGTPDSDLWTLTLTRNHFVNARTPPLSLQEPPLGKVIYIFVD